MLINQARVKLASGIVFMAPFVPMIFQGEEWGAGTPFQYFSGHPDSELGRAVSEGRKREFVAFGWREDEVPDPQAFDTFARSRLNWNELSAEPHSDLLGWYRRLIQLRGRWPELTNGRRDSLVVTFDEAERWMVFQRGRILVLCNFSDQPRQFNSQEGHQPKLLLASKPSIELNSRTIISPPESITILSTRSQK
jgi:maltooligosyltrehalose trehalohydrolase